MKPLRLSRSVVCGLLLALGLHALLFLAADGEPRISRTEYPVPPATGYAVADRTALPSEGENPRLINSPVLFSLPSEMGFSRTLLNQDVTTRLTFPYNMATEAYLRTDSVPDSDNRRLNADAWMATGLSDSPELPPVPTEPAPFVKRPVRRVILAPELEERLVGGIVLPPILNRAAAEPWEVQATVDINKQGLVQHVFIEQPLADAPLNHAVIRMLHSLRFRSGPSLTGRIEVYAPEYKPAPNGEAAP